MVPAKGHGSVNDSNEDGKKKRQSQGILWRYNQGDMLVCHRGYLCWGSRGQENIIIPDFLTCISGGQ